MFVTRRETRSFLDRPREGALELSSSILGFLSHRKMYSFQLRAELYTKTHNLKEPSKNPFTRSRLVRLTCRRRRRGLRKGRRGCIVAELEGEWSSGLKKKRELGESIPPEDAIHRPKKTPALAFTGTRTEN